MPAAFWSNVGIAFQSALGATKTITAISLATTGVVTSTAHGLANGTFVLLTISGMYQLNDRVVRVAATAANTFELEGVDTTLFSAFSSGSCVAVTYGTVLGTGLTVSVSGGDPEFADVTTIHDSVRKRVPVVTSPLSMTMELIFDPTDAAFPLLKAASESLLTRAVRITFSNGWKVVFNGYVAAAGFPAGSAQDTVKTNLSVEGQGRPTVYTT